MDLFLFIFLWGIPLLFLWSFVLTIIQTKKAGKEGLFMGALTFISGIYTYTLLSFLAWFGLICLAFACAALVEGSIFGALFFGGVGCFLLYEFFPRVNMPE